MLQISNEQQHLAIQVSDEMLDDWFEST